MKQTKTINGISAETQPESIVELLLSIQTQLKGISLQLNSSNTTHNERYLTAKQVEVEYGLNSKTILNRSNLPASHHRHIPTVRLGKRGKKMFERKVLDRMLSTHD